MSTPREDYLGRVHRVMDHIDAHLADPLDLPSLAAVAAFSPWHFHRVFLAVAGETPGDRVRRRRLEVAALRLLATPARTALSIALDVGFGSAEVFTRAFKAHFGVTPSAWRRGGHRAWSQARHAQLRNIHQAHGKAHQDLAALLADDRRTAGADRGSTSKGSTMKVTIDTLPPLRVAYLRHVGAYGDPAIGALWQRFAAWCTAQGLAGRACWGVTRDAPDITVPEQCRYDCAVEVDEGFRPSGPIAVQTVPGGLYACTDFTGPASRIHDAWMVLCGDWLPGSGWQSDDRPSLEAYGTGLSVDPVTGAFSCRLCFPVRAA